MRNPTLFAYWGSSSLISVQGFSLCAFLFFFFFFVALCYESVNAPAFTHFNVKIYRCKTFMTEKQIWDQFLEAKKKCGRAHVLDICIFLCFNLRHFSCIVYIVSRCALLDQWLNKPTWGRQLFFKLYLCVHFWVYKVLKCTEALARLRDRRLSTTNTPLAFPNI